MLRFGVGWAAPPKESLGSAVNCKVIRITMHIHLERAVDSSLHILLQQFTVQSIARDMVAKYTYPHAPGTTVCE